jgi:hypothetical protein
VGEVHHFHEVDQRRIRIPTLLHRHRRLCDQIVQIVRMSLDLRKPLQRVKAVLVQVFVAPAERLELVT